MFKIVCFFAFIFTTAWAQDCKWVATLDCSARYPVNVVCGTDGKNYQNRCFILKAQCLDPTIHIVNEGSCESIKFTPTSAPAATTSSGNVVTSGSGGGVTTVGPISATHESIFVNHDKLLDYYCLELMHETCKADTEKVCGTDNVTYANFCEYEKQKCAHRNLQVKYFAQCS